MAMASGVYAAEAVIEAKNRSDFSKAILDGYVKRLFMSEVSLWRLFIDVYRLRRLIT